jgi:nicotinamidase-related amidase
VEKARGCWKKLIARKEITVNIQAVIVDPQNDFCDSKGTLYVNGGEKDMTRLAKMIERIGGKLDDIHITMDSHRLIDISHRRPKMCNLI